VSLEPERGEKTSIYLPGDVLAEMRAEAQRQDRSLSWLLRMAWRLARDRLVTLPGAPQ
jgi:uncharacterized small protein (TIGR04563 family)